MLEAKKNVNKIDGEVFSIELNIHSSIANNHVIQ